MAIREINIIKVTPHWRAKWDWDLFRFFCDFVSSGFQATWIVLVPGMKARL